MQKKTGLLEWDINKGDWVEEGQVIAHYNVKNSRFQDRIRRAEILAPFSGEILLIKDKDCTNWIKADGTTKPGEDFSSHDILFVVKPSIEYLKMYPDFLGDNASYRTYINLAIFTECAKIPNNGSTDVHAKALVETITT